MPAAPSSSVELLELVRKSGVAPAPKVNALAASGALPPDTRQAAAVLVQQGLITQFQAQQLLQGRYRGFRIGSYLIRDQLGRGGMGAVYLAEHEALRRQVALKILVAGKDADQKLALERFLREARAAAALDHPNIVRIHDVSRHGDVPYLVMEYVDGETLQERVDRDGPLHYAQAADYIAQAAAGLQHAHEKGFVHRDVKPSNLMVDRAGVVKILDMGLARSAVDERDRLTEKLDQGAVVGTADFIAPEQALSSPSVDGRADIYSLGATFYALVTGKPPFDGNTTQKLLQHQLKAPPPLSAVDPDLPEELSAVVARMMAKKPEARYQTPAEVIAALAPWLGNSSLVLAGLSRTNLARSADLSTLDGLSGLRLGATPAPRRLVVASGTDSMAELDATVDPSLAGQETTAVAGADTAKSPVQRPVAPARKRKPGRPAPARKQAGVQKAVIIAGVGLAVLAGAVAGALAFATRKAPPPAAETAADQPKKAEPGPPTPLIIPNLVIPAANPAPQGPPPGQERVITQHDLSGIQPFAIRSGILVGPDNQKMMDILSKTGGDPPAGWAGRCWHQDTQMDFFADDRKGSLALGIRNVQGPGSAMLFMPRFDCPSGTCRVRFEYQASVRAGRFNLRFKPTNPGGNAWDVTRPTPTGDGWRTEELVVDLRGARAGFFEFHNNDEDPDAELRVRAVTVTELPGWSAAPSPRPDLRGWAEGAVLWRLDVPLIAPFRVTKENTRRVAGEPEALPAGVQCYCWKADAIGEFRCDDVDGARALGVTNLNDEKSGQFTFELEQGVGLTLQPGRAYLARIVYSTANEATGHANVQNYQYQGQASAGLPNTGGAWRTAAISFVRPDDMPLRLTIDNTSVGEGNTLFIRSVELVELMNPTR
jgi:serine/threonine protein kinase